MGKSRQAELQDRSIERSWLGSFEARRMFGNLAKGTSLACPSCQFSLDDLFVGLGESGFGFNPQPPGVVKQLFYTLLGNFPVEQLAHPRLRLRQDHLQLLLRI